MSLTLRWGAHVSAVSLPLSPASTRCFFFFFYCIYLIHLFSLYSFIIYCSFVLANKFDLIWFDHNILLTKLKDRGVPHCLVKWFHSYPSFRCQTVRVDNQYSDRVYITAGMPQDSPLGLLSFLLLIDDLTVDCLTHKHVDDTTFTELLPRGSQQTNSHADFPSAVAHLGHPKQNEDKLHEDQGDDPRLSCIMSSSTVIWLFY